MALCAQQPEALGGHWLFRPHRRPVQEELRHDVHLRLWTPRREELSVLLSVPGRWQSCVCLSQSSPELAPTAVLGGHCRVTLSQEIQACHLLRKQDAQAGQQVTGALRNRDVGLEEGRLRNDTVTVFRALKEPRTRR